jgi:hypothetical protein
MAINDYHGHPMVHGHSPFQGAVRAMKVNSLILITYWVDTSQLQMVIAGYITIKNMLLHNSSYKLWKV